MTTATIAAGLPAPAPAPQRLVATLGALGLFGRLLLFGIGEILIVPMPWVTPMFYRYLCGHLALPDGRRLQFAGKPGDIWHILIGIPLIMWIIQIVNVWRIFPIIKQHPSSPPGFDPSFLALFIVAEIGMFYLGFLALRWAIARTTSEDGSIKLSFGGSFLGLIGWTLLFGLSSITIIGPFWVLKAQIRWMCRKVDGSVQFDFIGGGWGILWRAVLGYLACIFIIPIPWIMAWITNWLFSNVVVTSGAKA